jgi:hypothetical protein
MSIRLDATQPSYRTNALNGIFGGRVKREQERLGAVVAGRPVVVGGFGGRAGGVKRGSNDKRIAGARPLVVSSASGRVRPPNTYW